MARSASLSGRALDLAIAKAKGYELYPQHMCGASGFDPWRGDTCPGCDFKATSRNVYREDDLPRWSSRIEDAWKLVEELAHQFPAVNPWRISSTLQGYCCRLRTSFGPQPFVANGVTAPEAIARAYLDYLGGERQELPPIEQDFAAEENPFRDYCTTCGQEYVFVRPGKTQPNCDCHLICDRCGGKYTYHKDDPRFPQVNGEFCDNCGPFPIDEEVNDGAAQEAQEEGDGPS